MNPARSWIYIASLVLLLLDSCGESTASTGSSGDASVTDTSGDAPSTTTDGESTTDGTSGSCLITSGMNVVINGPTGNGGDAAAIQAALTKVATAGGGTVTLMPGTYLITEQIHFSLPYAGTSADATPAKNVVLQGSTCTASDTQLTPSGSAMVGAIWIINDFGFGDDSITIQNILFNMVGSEFYSNGYGCGAIHFGHSVLNLLIKNCYFENTYLGRTINIGSLDDNPANLASYTSPSYWASQGINIQPPDQANNVTIDNCTFYNLIGYVAAIGLPPDWEAIAFYNVANATFSNNVFDTYATYDAGIIQIWGLGNNGLITNNTFKNKLQGIDISILNSTNYTISNNTSNSTPLRGQFMYIADSNGIYVNNNTLTGGCSGASPSDCPGGIGFFDATGLFCGVEQEPSQNVYISNNTFTNIYSALYLPNTEADDWQAESNVSFTYNTIISPISSSVLVGRPEVDGLSNITVSNNQFSDLSGCTGSPGIIDVVGNPSASNYGITGLTIANNSFSGSGSPPCTLIGISYVQQVKYSGNVYNGASYSPNLQNGASIVQ